jgi:hypothetical protein
LAVIVGVAEAGKSVQGQTAGVAVVNDQARSAASGFPAASVVPAVPPWTVAV